MRQLIVRIVLLLASYASLIGIYLTIQPINGSRPGWHWLLLDLALIAGIFLVASETYDHFASLPKSYRTTKKINDYMRRWVSSGGRVVILSRDMSWAQDDTVQTILATKAKCGDLTICLEKSTPLTDALAQDGATIVTYNQLGHIPRSRFTIVDFERDGARVAVGVKQKGVHVIQEFQSGSHPFFAVAEDLAKFLIALSRNT